MAYEGVEDGSEEVGKKGWKVGEQEAGDGREGVGWKRRNFDKLKRK